MNNQIKREFEACRVFNPSSSSASFNSTLQQCHVFGPGIYIGWLAMFLLICAGALMACGSHRVDEESQDSRVYRFSCVPLSYTYFSSLLWLDCFHKIASALIRSLKFFFWKCEFLFYSYFWLHIDLILTLTSQINKSN